MQRRALFVVLGLMIAGCGEFNSDGDNIEAQSKRNVGLSFSEIDHDTRNECIHWCQFDPPECYTQICSGVPLCTPCCNQNCSGENDQGYSDENECKKRCGGPSEGQGYGDECRRSTSDWTECASCCDGKMGISL